MIRVGLVDDQPLVRSGFALLVASQEDMVVSWQASDGDEIPENCDCDIVLMDIQMKRCSGIDACRELLARDAHVHVIMLTTFDDPTLVAQALDAGAAGFLLKDAQPEELLSAIRTVAEGNAVLSPQVTKDVIKAARSTESVQSMVDEMMLENLTPREIEVLKLMALGYSNDEIADREFVSMATVKTHVRHILMKTNSRDRVHAVLFAFRAGLVSKQELLSLGDEA